jgi:hypothetical protein
LILGKIVSSFEVWAQVRADILALKQAPSFLCPEHTTNDNFTRDLVALVDQYPLLAEAFFQSLGAVKTHPQVDLAVDSTVGAYITMSHVSILKASLPKAGAVGGVIYYYVCHYCILHTGLFFSGVFLCQLYANAFTNLWFCSRVH